MTKWFYRAVGTVGIASGICLLGSGAAQANEPEAAPLQGLFADLLTPLGSLGGVETLDPLASSRVAAPAPADDTLAIVGDLAGTAGATVSDLRVGQLSLLQVSHGGDALPLDVLPANLRSAVSAHPAAPSGATTEALDGLPLVGGLLGGAGGAGGPLGALGGADGTGPLSGLTNGQSLGGAGGGPLGALKGLPLVGGLVPGGAAPPVAAPGSGVHPADDLAGASTMPRPAPTRKSGERPVAGDDIEYTESAGFSATEGLPLLGSLSSLPLLGSLGSLPSVKQTPAVSQLPLPLGSLQSLPLVGGLTG